MNKEIKIEKERKKEYEKIENILIEMIEDKEDGEVMREWNVDMDYIKNIVNEYIEREMENIIKGYDED